MFQRRNSTLLKNKLWFLLVIGQKKNEYGRGEDRVTTEYILNMNQGEQFSHFLRQISE